MRNRGLRGRPRPKHAGFNETIHLWPRRSLPFNHSAKHFGAKRKDSVILPPRIQRSPGIGFALNQLTYFWPPGAFLSKFFGKHED